VVRIDTQISQEPLAIVKIHYFSLIFNENISDLMKNHAFSRFSQLSWKILVSIQTTFPGSVQA
jgi:hypothetical protein